MKSSSPIGVLFLALAMIVVLGTHVGAKTDPCKVACSAQKRGCRTAFKTAFRADKADCPGRGKAKRECVKAARAALRAAVRACREFSSDCRGCCKNAGTSCDVRCGDGIVSSGEDCDPPGSDVCPGGGACSDACRCPALATTTSSTAVAETSSTTTTASGASTSSQSTTTEPETSSTTTTTDPGEATTTSTEPPVSTTVTTTSSTTTTTDSCAGLPDGIGCQPDANPCTADVCVGGTCTHDMPQGSFVTCRPANGAPCDAADHCGGTTCPDTKKLAGQVCTPLVAAQYPCNLGDSLRCDGVHEYCPSERLCDNAAECSADEQCFSRACYQGICIDRVGAGGSCDSAQDCADGLTCNGGICVTDTATGCMGLPAGTPCRPAVDACDVAESCTGESPSCPPDAFAPANTICRSSQGACDLADVCTGTFAGCPDRIADVGFPCGSDLVGPCHPVQETCNGSKACPTPVYFPCQLSQGPCDIVDSCNPATNPNFPNCPPDAVAPFGTPCDSGMAVGVCQETVCSGEGSACTTVRNRAPSYVCRPAANDCDVADTCGVPLNNPNFPECRNDAKQPDDTTCHTVPDGLFGMCTAGQCVQETCKYDIDCPDGMVCNTSTWHCVAQASGQGSACTGQSGSIVGTCTGGLVCCAGMEGDGVGGYAGAGQTGRCAQCCGNQQSTIDDCDDPERECCDGRCINVSTSDEHCGGCTPRSNTGFGTGEDCHELDSACYQDGHCEFGTCLTTSVCGDPNTTACYLPPDPACTGLFCVASVDPLCTSGWPDFPGCNVSCQSFAADAECLNAACTDDDDCCPGLSCLVTCTQRDYGFCDQKTCQAR